MVCGLNELPPILSLFTKDVLQPTNASLKGIVNKTETILITCDGRPFFPRLWFWKLVDGYLIFPLYHTSPFRLLFSGISMKYITRVSRAETSSFAAIFQLLSPVRIITHLLAQKGNIFIVTLHIGSGYEYE